MKTFNISTSSGEKIEITLETVIKDYIAFSVIPRSIPTENGQERDLEPAEREHFRKCGDEVRDKLKQICKLLEKDSPEETAEYLNTFAKLYEEDKENRKLIKNALFEPPSVSLIKKNRYEAFDKVYDAITRIDKVVPQVDDRLLSLNPKSSLYGWMETYKKGSTTHSPLTNEIILETLKVFIRHEDRKRLSEWIIEILSYDKDGFPSEAFADKFDAERMVLLKNLELMMKDDDALRSILVKELLEGSMLFDLAKQAKDAVRVKDLEAKLLQQEEDFKKEKEVIEKDFWERAERQKKIIEERNMSISELRSELKEYEQLEKNYKGAGKKLDDTLNDLESQKQINNELNEQLSQKDESIDSLNRELLLAKTELTEVNEKLEAIKVDITLKNNEIARLKESVGSKDSDATDNLLKGLISNLNDQIFYLSMFYQILSEDNGVLDEMNLDMFKEVLLQVDSALEEIGLKKLGTLDEVVEYNSAIHNPVSESIANGEKVKVTGFGWEINGEVFIKIPVEKEVQ